MGSLREVRERVQRAIGSPSGLVADVRAAAESGAAAAVPAAMAEGNVGPITIAAGLFSGLATLSGRRGMARVVVDLQVLEDKLNALDGTKVDLDYLDSDAFLAQLAGHMHFVIRNDHEEKLEAARNLLLRTCTTQDENERSLALHFSQVLDRLTPLEVACVLLFEGHHGLRQDTLAEQLSVDESLVQVAYVKFHRDGMARLTNGVGQPEAFDLTQRWEVALTQYGSRFQHYISAIK